MYVKPARSRQPNFCMLWYLNIDKILMKLKCFILQCALNAASAYVKKCACMVFSSSQLDGCCYVILFYSSYANTFFNNAYTGIVSILDPNVCLSFNSNKHLDGWNHQSLFFHCLGTMDFCIQSCNYMD